MFCRVALGTQIVEQSTRQNIHMYPYFLFAAIHHLKWGRLMVFLNFEEQLDLTEEEWEQLFDFLVPTLIQIEEKVEI